MWKYKYLSPSHDLELIVFADRLFIVAAPMLVTTAAIALIAPSIFPDELDFRILRALPLSRRRIFTAKFVALFVFAAVAIVADVKAVHPARRREILREQFRFGRVGDIDRVDGTSARL